VIVRGVESAEVSLNEFGSQGCEDASWIGGDRRAHGQARSRSTSNISLQAHNQLDTTPTVDLLASIQHVVQEEVILAGTSTLHSCPRRREGETMSSDVNPCSLLF
jgi:hypothetical protein